MPNVFRILAAAAGTIGIVFLIGIGIFALFRGDEVAQGQVGTPENVQLYNELTAEDPD